MPWNNFRLNYLKFARVISIVIFSLLTFSFIFAIFFIFNSHLFNKYLYELNDNWVILFFKLNSGFAQRDTLQSLHLIDFLLLSLFGLLFFAFFILLKQKNIVYLFFMSFALISPFLGIILLSLTHSTGRTGILTGGLIFSILMLINNKFGKLIAIIGILANSIILISCDVLSSNHISKFTSILILFGYIFWIFWFILVSKRFTHIINNDQ